MVDQKFYNCCAYAGAYTGGHWGQLIPIRISVHPLNRKVGPDSKICSPANIYLLFFILVVLTDFGV